MKNIGKNWLILVFLLVFSTVHAQKQETLYIFSAVDKKPVAGATLRLWPSGKILKSDENGAVTLEVTKEKQEVHISHLAYNTKKLYLEFPLKEHKLFLESKSTALEEVSISTGYQKLPKERATGSFTVLDRETLSQQVSTDVLSRLENISSGLTVDRKTGATPRINIRGIGTILGNREPLIILDNFPYQGSLDHINPNDIEQITLLKDAAAASIWGARAGNGVVVITTKKAGFNQPLSVDVNSNIGIADLPDLYSLPKISSAGMVEVEQMLYEKGYYNSNIASSNKPALSPVVELLLAKSNGTVSAASVAEQLNSFAQHDVRDDYLKYQYQRPVNRQLALMLRSGTKNVNWTFSSGYDANTSNLAGQFNRLNLELKNSVKLGEALSINTLVRYTANRTLADKLAYGELTPNGAEQSPYTFLADKAGNPLPVVNTYRLSYTAGAGNGKLLDWSYYPLLDDQYYDRQTKVGDLLANVSVQYKIIKGLNFSVQYQYEKQDSHTKNLYDAASFMVRNLVNVYTQISNTGAITYKVPKGSILDIYDANLRSTNGRAQLNYDGGWEKHQVAVLAGAELQETLNEGYGNRSYGYDDSTLAFSPVDYTNTYPSFVSGSSSYIPQGSLTGFNSTLNRYVSMYSNMGYSYDNRYGISLSARKDASNLFGLLSNEKWKPLWSAGLFWNVNREAFFRSALFTTLRLRASFGYSGNVDPSRTAVTTITNQGASPYTQSSFARFNQYSNPLLRWEKIATSNIGVDFSLLNNRISGSIEIYQKHASDLYGNSPVDYTGINVTRLITNVAEIKGRGLDFSIKSLNTKGALRWNTDLNFSLYRDEVLNYYQSSRQGSNYTTGGQTITGLVGKPVYSILSYAWAGLDPLTGDPMGYYQGQVSKDYTAITGVNTMVEDLVYNGPAMPTVYGNIGNSLVYKGISLQLRLSYKMGYYFRRSGINYSSLFANGIGHSDYDGRWKQPGDELTTNIPSMVYPAVLRRDNFYNGSEALVEKGDHIRLAFIRFGYDFKSFSLQRLQIKRLGLYAYASNIGILWRANDKGIDPDYRNGSISNPRSYALGLNVSF